MDSFRKGYRVLKNKCSLKITLETINHLGDNTAKQKSTFTKSSLFTCPKCLSNLSKSLTLPTRFIKDKQASNVSTKVLRKTFSEGVTKEQALVPTTTLINNTSAETINNEYNYYLNWDEVVLKINEFKNNKESDPMVIKMIFKSLPKLGLPPEEIDVKELENQTILHLNKYDPIDLSMIYYWSCKMNFGDGLLRQHIAQKILDKSNLDDISSKHLMLMLYGTAVLNKEEKLIKRDLNFHKGMIERILLFENQDEFIDKLAKELTKPTRIVLLQEQELSNCMYSLGILNYNAKEVIFPLLHQITNTKILPRFLEQELANILQAISLLGLIGDPSVMTLVSEIIERERLRAYKEIELSSIFYSLSHLKFQNMDALNILVREAFRSTRLTQYKEHQLSNLIYSIDKLNVMEDKTWRAILTEICQPGRLERFEEHHLANIAYAIGRREIRNPNILRQVSMEIIRGERLSKYTIREFSLLMYGFSRVNYGNSLVLDAISKELSKEGRLKDVSISEKNYSGLLLSFAMLKHRNVQMIKRFNEEFLTSERVSKMEPDVLAHVIFSLGKLKAPLTSRIDEVLVSLLESEAKIEELSQKNLSMLIYGLGQMGTDMRRYMDALLNVLLSSPGKIERFSVQDLSILMYSFGQMKLIDAYEVIDRVLRTFCRPDRIMYATCQNLSNLIYGLGQLKHEIKELPLQCLEKELILSERINNFSPQEISNILYSLGMLKLSNRPGIQDVLDKLTATAIKPEKLAKFKEIELNCLLTGLSYLRYKEPGVLVPLLEELTQDNRLQRLSPKDISSIIYVIGQVEVCPDEFFEKLMNEVRKEDRIKDFDLTSITMIIYSLGKLRDKSRHEAIRIMSNHLLHKDLCVRLNEQHLTNILYGYVFTYYESEEHYDVLFKEMTKHFRVNNYDVSDILNICRALLELRNRKAEIKGVEYVLKLFAIEMTSPSRLGQFNPSQLTHVLQILGILKNKNIATLFPILQHLSKPEFLHILSPLDVSRAIFSIGPMAFVNSELHPRLALTAKPILRQVASGKGPISMTCQSIAELFIGMSMLGLQDTFVLDHISNEVIKTGRLRSFRAWHLARIFYAVAQLRYDNLELLRTLASELSKPERAERLDYRHWSNIMTAVLMLKFKDESFAKVIEKHVSMPSSTPSNIENNDQNSQLKNMLD